MTKATTTSRDIQTPDEERDYNDLLNQLDSLRVLLVDASFPNQSNSSTKKTSNTPNYNELANFFRDLLAENHKKLRQLLSENKFLANEISKKEGFRDDIKINFLGTVNVNLTVRSLSATINKKLSLIRDARISENLYITADKIQINLPPIEELDCDIDLSDDTKKIFQEALQRTFSPFKNQLNTIKSLTNTPVHTFLPEDEQLNKLSYLRIKIRENAFEKAGLTGFFENMSVTLHQIFQSYLALLEPSKKEEAIIRLEQITNHSAYKNYINILKQFEFRNESIKSALELEAQKKKNSMIENHAYDIEFIEKSLKNQLFPLIFSIKIQNSLREQGLIATLNEETERYSSTFSQARNKEEIINTLGKIGNDGVSQKDIKTPGQIEGYHAPIKTPFKSIAQEKLIELERNYKHVNEVLENKSKLSFIPPLFVRKAEDSLTDLIISIDKELKPYYGVIHELKCYITITGGIRDKIQKYFDENREKTDILKEKTHRLISLLPQIDQANYLIETIQNILIEPYKIPYVELEKFKRESFNTLKGIIDFFCAQIEKIDNTSQKSYSIDQLPHLNFNPASSKHIESEGLSCDVKNDRPSPPSSPFFSK